MLYTALDANIFISSGKDVTKIFSFQFSDRFFPLFKYFVVSFSGNGKCIHTIKCSYMRNIFYILHHLKSGVVNFPKIYTLILFIQNLNGGFLAGAQYYHLKHT